MERTRTKGKQEGKVREWRAQTDEREEQAQ